METAHKNADRFSGFANVYQSARPACPDYIVRTLTRYLDHRPQTVVDIGCGTGLSTYIWSNVADQVIGVEPSSDMLAEASTSAAQHPNTRFMQAFSDNTGIENECADIVTCSQSFHWMEPTATLREINRLLKPGGVFAAYDYDGLPVCNTDVELAQKALLDKVNMIETERAEYKEAFHRYPKEHHLDNIRSSGYFKYAREIVFANAESSDADRFYGGALSQGGLQAILQREPALIEDELKAFRSAVEKYFGNQTREINFCYRMRLGVKKDREETVNA